MKHWLEQTYARILLFIMVWAGRQMFQYVDVGTDEKQEIVESVSFSRNPSTEENE